MTAPVLCFGNLQLDVLCRPVTALPRSGTFSMLDSIDFLISGNGGNVATVLSRLGLDVELAGYSGADITGEHIRTLLGRMGVGINKLLRHPTARTGTSIITLSPDGERSGFFVNGANALFDLHSVPDAWLQNRQVVSVGSVFVLPQFTGEAIRQLFSRAHIYGATTVLNLCWDSERQGLAFLRGALAEADYCILNAAEGHRLTGHSQPEQILSVFTTLTSGYTIVTKGSDGCYLSTSLARLQYQASLHADGWRTRVDEMRTNKSKLEGSPDPALTLLFDEAEHLPGTWPFLSIVTQFLKPALCEAYRAYMQATNHLADYGSIRCLSQALALSEIVPAEDEQRLACQWQASLVGFLAAAGGIDGTVPRGLACAPGASVKPYTIAHILSRDSEFPRVWDYITPPPEDVEAYLNYMMAMRLSEINVSEGLALVLYETQNMPWDFYRDISRHCWDEMRHSLFGEAAVEATYGDHASLPLRDYEGIFALEAPPLEQYAVLGLEVEGKNMKYPPGKRQEWEFVRDQAQHPLMTTFQDFDWADEVLHVNIARRQLNSWFAGGLQTIGSFAKEGKEHRTEVKHRHAPTQLPFREPVEPPVVPPAHE